MILYALIKIIMGYEWWYLKAWRKGKSPIKMELWMRKNIELWLVVSTYLLLVGNILLIWMVHIILMVIIWLMMVNNDGYYQLLVGGFNQPLWKMMEWKSVGMIFHSQYDGKVIPSIKMFQLPPTRTNFPGRFKLAMFDFQLPCLITQLGSS